MFNPSPRIDTVPIAPGQECLIIDGALTQPERWVALAAEHAAAFQPAPYNAYPGIELRMPDEVSAQLHAFFAQHIRRRLRARRTVRMYSRLSLVTLAPDLLAPRQWIAHRDRFELAPDRRLAACVLYLFKDEALGGTNFFAPRRSPQETAVMIHESGVMPAADFARKYGVTRGYQTTSNAWFEKTVSIPAKWNRLIFYDGGSVFHCSDIPTPDKLSPDPRTGRLTLNGFFVCRQAVG